MSQDLLLNGFNHAKAHMTSKKNLKNMVAEIEKLAKSIPPPAPTGAGRSVPRPGGPEVGTGVSADPVVARMQEAILEFGRVLAAHPTMSMEESGQLERPGAKEPDYLGGTKPFGNFLVNQYVNNAKVVGDQFVNIDLPEPQRTGTAMRNVDLKGVINTISRVGRPGKEHKPDGIWGTRTDNALKQIYAVGMSLMQFGRDMRMEVGEFPNYLRTLKDQILNVEEDKSKRAGIITKVIEGLTSLYKSFETNVLEHPELKNLISQEKAFVDHSEHVPVELSKEEQSLLEANRSAVIPGVNINGQPVRLADLESPPAFSKFLQNANIDVSKPGEVEKNVAAVKTALKEGDLGPGF